MARRGWIRAGGVVAVTTAVAVIVPGTAYAGGPGSWTALSSYPASGYPRMGNIDAPTVLRGGGSQLQVLWKRSTTSSLEEYRTALVRPSGTTAVTDRTVFGQWSSLFATPRLRYVDGEKLLLFGTAAPAAPDSTPVNGQGRFATSIDGLSWALSSQVVSGSTSFYAGYGHDIVDTPSGPLTITNGVGGGTSTQLDAGIFSPFPAAAPATTAFNAPGAGCCSYNAAIERDGVTGDVWGAYYSNASSTTARGVQYAQAFPWVSSFRQVPGTSTTGSYNGTTDNGGARIAMAARAGGGVYLATPVGYPSRTGIRVLRLGTSTSIFIPAPNAYQVSIAAAPGGRMWVSWIDRSNGAAVVRAVRSNAAGTAFGARTLVGKPARSTQLWQLTSDGSAAGLLDVVTTSSASTSAINVFHTQARATLSASATVKRTRSGKVLVVKVTDAGVIVRNAAVTVRGVTKRTGRLGTTAFAIPATLRGRVAVRVALAGYNGVTLTPRVG